MEQNTKTESRTAKLLELHLIGLYVLIRLFQETAYCADSAGIMQILNCLKYGIAFLSGIKLAADLFRRRIPGKALAVMLAAGLLITVVVYCSKVEELLVFWILICSAFDLNLDDICRFYLCSFLAVIAITVIGAYLGCFENVIIVRQRGTAQVVRESLGFGYYSTVSHITFFLTVIYGFYRKEKISYPEILLLAVFQVFIYVHTKTRNPFLFGMLCTGVYSVLKLTGNTENRIPKFKGLVIGLPFVCAVLVFSLAFAYTKSPDGLLFQINEILSGRIAFECKALEENGLSLFGKEIIWKLEEDEYNIVDSSYFNIMLNYGVVLTLAVLIQYVLLLKHAVDRKDIYLIAAVSTICLYCMADSFLMILYVNPFLFAFSYVYDNRTVLLTEHR